MLLSSALAKGVSRRGLVFKQRSVLVGIEFCELYNERLFKITTSRLVETSNVIRCIRSLHVIKLVKEYADAIGIYR